MGVAKSGSSSRSSESKAPRRLRRLLLRAMLVFAALFGFLAWRTFDYSRNIMTPPQADIAIVLGARTEGDKPTPVFQERIEYGIQLFVEGKVQRLLFTGAPGNPPQAIVARDIALRRGVPEAAILVETQSMRTIENLRYARDLIPDPANTRVLIVSDPLHLRRAMEMAEDSGFAKAYPAPTPSTRVRSSWSQFKMTMRETVAYLRYRIERLF
ncbi:MAG: YdcF family protein [Deltaproteobacteria bacterium]|nr:YdcF family protein [Deltaproteobacteria bacterium]